MANELRAAQFNVHDVRHALEHDREFFIQFFLADELTHPIPPIHIEIFSLMVWVEVLRFVCAIPRAHAKTTLAKLTVIWYMLFSDFRYFVYVSAAQKELAVPYVNDIVAMLESDNFRAVFGAIEWHTHQDGAGFYVFTIPTIKKRVILKALGVGQTMRGTNIDGERPEFAVLDDIENLENIATEILFKKMKKWVYGTFIKAMNQFHNKIIHLGNMVYKESMLNMHVHSAVWYSRLYGCIRSDGTPLWPDLWPIEALIADFIAYQEAGETETWFAEMMNLPMSPSGGLIKAEEITYAPRVTPQEISFGFLTYDPAISEKKWAHKAVLMFHGWHEERQQWQVCEYIVFSQGDAKDPVKVFPSVTQMMAKWGTSICGIEDQAYQASIKYVWAHLALMRGYMNLSFLPIHAHNMQKTSRLAAWCGMVRRKQDGMPGDYALTEGDFALTQQMLTYNPNARENDDDIFDAGAMGLYMISNYMHLIASQQPTFIEQTATPLVQYSPV